MTHYDYLIIGGGMTGATAANGIRELTETGTIGLFSIERERPYDRPPLSKKLWTGKKRLEDVYVPISEGVDLLLGRRVESIDPERKTAREEGGETHTYGKLLLATGGASRRLPFGGDRVNYYRTLDDFRELRGQALASSGRFVVIGGGFIGSEVAASLRQQGCEVTMVFPDAGITDRIFPARLSALVSDYYRQHGVEVLAGEKVTGIEAAGDEVTVLTASGRRLEAAAVVAGIGIVPGVELAQAAGLRVDNGIVVDEYLRAGPDIYAAGDVANYPDAVLGVRRRVEHADAARAMGRTAGRNMAGADEPYTHLPMFYSDLFDIGYEAVGQVDARLQVVEDWLEPDQSGVLYYLENGRVRGALMWNLPDRVDQARALVAAGEIVTPESVLGRIR